MHASIGLGDRTGGYGCYIVHSESMADQTAFLQYSPTIYRPSVQLQKSSVLGTCTTPSQVFFRHLLQHPQGHPDAEQVILNAS